MVFLNRMLVECVIDWYKVLMVIVGDLLIILMFDWVIVFVIMGFIVMGFVIVCFFLSWVGLGLVMGNK